jgi:hypothetical protein
MRGNTLSINSCYQILELQPGASKKAVKTAHRRMAMQWHPDRHEGSTSMKAKALRKMQHINAAYQKLKDYTPPKKKPAAKKPTAKKRAAPRAQGTPRPEPKKADWYEPWPQPKPPPKRPKPPPRQQTTGWYEPWPQPKPPKTTPPRSTPRPRPTPPPVDWAARAQKVGYDSVDVAEAAGVVIGHGLGFVLNIIIVLGLFAIANAMGC